MSPASTTRVLHDAPETPLSYHTHTICDLDSLQFFLFRFSVAEEGLGVMSFALGSTESAGMPQTVTTTLADVLTMVPDLHPRHLASTKVITMQQLRLVCKDLCSVAQNTIQSISIPLGHHKHRLGLAPQHAVRLLEAEQLHTLTVSVTVASGEGLSKFT